MWVTPVLRSAFQGAVVGWVRAPARHAWPSAGRYSLAGLACGRTLFLAPKDSPFVATASRMLQDVRTTRKANVVTILLTRWPLPPPLFFERPEPWL